MTVTGGSEEILYAPAPVLKNPRYRFRALVRKVIANAHWLREELEGPGISSFAKTVKLLMKSKKDVLGPKDRSILSKWALHRTPQENAHLFRQIGGLKCFKKYPTHVRRKLAECTYYVFFGPFRDLIRQGHDALCLYFIISGEVSVSMKTWDPLFGEWNTKHIGNLGEGDMFGEVALLHNIKRTATITTMTDTELLCIYKSDFDLVLKATIQRQWEEIKSGMKKFTYFENYDQMNLQEACIVSKKKVYSRDSVILGDGFGNPNYCYFVLSGSCQVIEKLKVQVQTKNGIPHYKLYDVKSEGEVSAISLRGLNKGSNVDEHGRRKSQYQLDFEKRKSEVFISQKKNRDLFEAKHQEQSNFEIRPRSKTKLLSFEQLKVKPSIFRFSEPDLEPINVQTYFIQLCILKPMSCFGLGENMDRRRIVAKTQVECLLIPKFWLFQRNEGNIWNRTRNYLENNIPTHKAVFKHFIKRKKWLIYRREEFERCLHEAKKSKKCKTNKHDVPYSLRILFQDISTERKFTYEY